MPIYEYHCAACGHEFEQLQKVSDPQIKKCPECGKLKVEKLVSASGFKLKGTGWYETDFKNSDKKENKKAATEASAPAKDNSSNDKGTKKNDKPATTTES